MSQPTSQPSMTNEEANYAALNKTREEHERCMAKPPALVAFLAQRKNIAAQLRLRLPEPTLPRKPRHFNTTTTYPIGHRAEAGKEIQRCQLPALQQQSHCPKFVSQMLREKLSKHGDK